YGENPKLLKSHENIKVIANLAMPLLVIKPPKSVGDLKISNAQVALSDLPATLTSMMGTKKVINKGRSVFSVDPGEIRSRKFYHYLPCSDCTKDGYFVPFEEFDIRGSLFDIASWNYVGLKRSAKEESPQSKSKEQ
ncbi:MAG: hypothetical protein IME98_05380, partial [Proteobacteria bacterium]|nr:hypothetical protein [Pseudomonadota bacterium]